MVKLKNSKCIYILISLALLIILTSSLAGILLDDGGNPYEILSQRNEKVNIYGGEGLYRYDDVTKAVTFRGFDWANLVIGLPVFSLSIYFYCKGQLRGQFMMAAFFAYLAYNYMIGVVGNAFNSMFLVWTAIYSTGLFGLAYVLKNMDFSTIEKRMEKIVPRKALAIYMMFLGLFLLFSYLYEVVLAYIHNVPPASLSHYTTLELASIELGIMAPLHILGSVLLWKKKNSGIVLGAILAFTACMTFLSLSIAQILTFFQYQTGNLGDVIIMLGLAFITSVFSIIIFTRIKEKNYSINA